MKKRMWMWALAAGMVLACIYLGIKEGFVKQVFWPGAVSMLLLFAALTYFRRPAPGLVRVDGVQVHTRVPDVTLQDVAANHEAVACMRELVDFLKEPEKYARYGARLPRGVMLYGPPGTGKTLLARALAGEAKVPFYSVNGSDFVQMYVGVGASRVRELFRKARKGGSGVIFIDEIDAVGKKRDNGSDEREQTLNALLTEMSGFDSQDGIVVLAATNRLDTLDEALLRAGRFDRQIEVGLPDREEREKILRVHAKRKPLSEDVSLSVLAAQTAMFSGAQLESLLNEAAIIAARRGEGSILRQDVEQAYLQTLLGAPKGGGAAFEKEKRITAYHEAGHALLLHLLLPEQRITRLSVLPSSRGAAGYTLSQPEETLFQTRKQLIHSLIATLGGRAAEEIAFGRDQVTTGASGDIRRARAQVKRMVRDWDMGEGGDWEQDERSMLARAYRDALGILKKHRAVLDALAQELQQKENLDGEQFLEIMIRYIPDTIYPQFGGGQNAALPV
ncbi:MAG: ATP-dependent zinc metalloprotease FtsH [Clostridiales bacterium]|nr:ATP-dependent zinc metalloprotease FtsH [Clostridiales bacterium]